MENDTGSRALLIDYGGVLTNPLAPVFTEFCRGNGLRDDAILALHGPDCAFRQELEAYERGEYLEEEFLPRFARALGLAPVAMRNLLHGVRPDECMFKAVESIRAQGIRTGLLSNSWGLSAYPRDRFATMFDCVVISGEVGMRKPEPEIYFHAAGMLGVRPADCVMVDDTGANLAPALAAGMTVIHHRASLQTLRELERLFRIAVDREG